MFIHTNFFDLIASHGCMYTHASIHTEDIHTTYLLTVWTSSGKQHVLSLQLHNQLEMSVK